MFKLKLILVLCLVLSACSNAELASNEREDSLGRIKTAKINAQLGIAYLERNNVQRAKKKLLLALQQAPNIPETWYSMAYFLETTGNREEANNYYQKAIAMAPGRGDSQNNYGTFLCRGGKYQEAIKHFMLAVNDPDYLNPSDALENAGLCAMKNDTHLAAEYFTRAVIYDPSRPVSLLKLAEINYKEGKFNDAKKRLTDFLDTSPANQESIQLSHNLRSLKEVNLA